MDDADVDKLFGPKIPKRKPRVAASTVEAPSTPALPAAKKDEEKKEGRIVPLENPDDFEKATRPFKPFASIFAKTYSKALGYFELSELDAEEREMVTKGTSAAMYEHFEALSGTMMFMFAMGMTGSVRVVELVDRKRKEKEAAAKQQALPTIPPLTVAK